MLATATRHYACSKNPRAIADPPSFQGTDSQALTNAFLTAFRNVGCTYVPRTRPLPAPSHRSCMDGLAGELWDTLVTGKLEPIVTESEAEMLLTMSPDDWAVVVELFECLGESKPISARFGIELGRGSVPFAQGLRRLGVQDIEVCAPMGSEILHFAAPRITSNDAPWQPKLQIINTGFSTRLQEINVNDGATVVGYGFEGLNVTVNYMDEEGYVVRSSLLEEGAVDPLPPEIEVPPLADAELDTSPREFLFQELKQSMRGRVLDLRDWTGFYAKAVLELDQDDWTEWRESLWKDVLDLVLVGAEIGKIRPLIDGVDQLCVLEIDDQVEDIAVVKFESSAPISRETGYRIKDRQARDAFFHATLGVREKHPDFDADRWFDRLLDAIEENTGTELDLSDCPQHVVDVLREFSPYAWEALLEHSEAVALQSIQMSQPLFDNGLLPVGLAQFLA